MNQEGYTHLRIDGKMPGKIEEFNGNSQLFAMIPTKGVGGVGLNIIGADRVVIVEPDWNPMTDAQARERAWLMCGKKDVSAYRLVQRRPSRRRSTDGRSTMRGRTWQASSRCRSRPGLRGGGQGEAAVDVQGHLRQAGIGEAKGRR